jgi:hypothetical protein
MKLSPTKPQSLYIGSVKKPVLHWSSLILGFREGSGSGSALFLKAGFGSAIERKTGSGYASKSKFSSLEAQNTEYRIPLTLTMEARRLKTEALENM